MLDDEVGRNNLGGSPPRTLRHEPAFAEQSSASAGTRGASTGEGDIFIYTFQVFTNIHPRIEQFPFVADDAPALRSPEGAGGFVIIPLPDQSIISQAMNRIWYNAF